MNLSGRDKSTPLTGISSPRFEEASKKIGWAQNFSTLDCLAQSPVADGIFSSPDFSLVAPLADFDWIVALEDGTSVPELLIIHIFGVNLIQVTHFTLCVDISLSLLGYHAGYHENIRLV
uniref:Uncharacterized protein n=1 Tax=Oryza sativa subsp. japonica TaxID=39947 RepID=Q6ZAV4_ORYSJ|nr:hypothetical protein [Oryza sativa Japonica Group]